VPACSGGRGRVAVGARDAETALRSGRGGHRLKSCHSDQHLAHNQNVVPTVSPTETKFKRNVRRALPITNWHFLKLCDASPACRPGKRARCRARKRQTQAKRRRRLSSITRAACRKVKGAPGQRIGARLMGSRPAVIDRSRAFANLATVAGTKHRPRHLESSARPTCSIMLSPAASVYDL